MIEKTVRIRIDKYTRLRYVIMPRTREVWIHEHQRVGLFRKKDIVHILKPEDYNMVHYEHVARVLDDLMWNVIERAIKMSNEKSWSM